MHFGSGYIEKRSFWRYGLTFGLVYFAGLVLVLPLWLSSRV